VIEAAVELPVAIVDQEPEWLLAIVERHQQVARLLGCPRAGRVRHAGDELDPAALERDEKEDVDPSQPGGLDGTEEITGKRRRSVLTQELPPRELASLRRRRQPMAPKNRAHRCRRHADTEAPQLADDPPVTPARVLASEPHNQRLGATIDRRPSLASARIRPAPPDQLAVPAQQRRRTHRQARPRTSRQCARERSQDRPVDGPKLHSARLPAQDRQLMPEHQDLELLRALRSAQQHHQLKAGDRAPDRRTTKPRNDLRFKEAAGYRDQPSAALKPRTEFLNPTRSGGGAGRSPSRSGRRPISRLASGRRVRRAA
jgi:hypothetical protein